MRKAFIILLLILASCAISLSAAPILNVSNFYLEFVVSSNFSPLYRLEHSLSATENFELSGAPVYLSKKADTNVPQDLYFKLMDYSVGAVSQNKESVTVEVSVVKYIPDDFYVRFSESESFPTFTPNPDGKCAVTLTKDPAGETYFSSFSADLTYVVDTYISRLSTPVILNQFKMSWYWSNGNGPTHQGEHTATIQVAITRE